MKFLNIYSLFRAQTATYRDLPVFFTREGSGWHSQTWNEFEEKVHDLACAFLAKGLTKGASVAILAGNVPEWTIVDIAAIAAGGVGVGIYPTSSAVQCEYIINHSEAEIVVVDTNEQLDKVLSSKRPQVKEIIAIERPKNTLLTGRVTAYDDLLEFGRQNREKLLPEVEAIGASAKPAGQSLSNALQALKVRQFPKLVIDAVTRELK